MELATSVAEQLSDALATAAIPVATVRYNGVSLEVVYAPQATTQQRTSGESIRSGFDLAQTTARDNVKLRSLATAAIDGQRTANARLIVAAALVVKDRVNVLDQWTVDLKAAVAGAGTFAALKTSVAALASLPQFTNSDIKTALANKLNSGDADAV